MNSRCSGARATEWNIEWSWGFNDMGQLGNGTASNSTLPAPVSGLTGVTAIAAGEDAYSAYALRSDGTVRAWGYNLYGELGDGTTTNSSVPVQVSGLTGVTAIAGGSRTGYALRSDGTRPGMGFWPSAGKWDYYRQCDTGAGVRVDRRLRARRVVTLRDTLQATRIIAAARPNDE